MIELAYYQHENLPEKRK